MICSCVKSQDCMGVFLGRVGDHMLKGEFNRKVLFLR